MARKVGMEFARGALGTGIAWGDLFRLTVKKALTGGAGYGILVSTEDRKMRVITEAASNAKTRKALGEMGITAGILHLSPSDFAMPGKSVCPWASKACAGKWVVQPDGTLEREEGFCLTFSGHGQYKGAVTPLGMEKHHIHRARNRKTRRFFNDRAAFLVDLHADCRTIERRGLKHGLEPAARLNGTSDIPWESMVDMGATPALNFYDYTKGYKRYCTFLAGDMPVNYHLTFSASEDTPDDMLVGILNAGGNVAMLFAHELPVEWMGFPVVDATAHDFRYRDPRGAVAGLLPKARAKGDTSGFLR
jgi:hypothetical protein